MDKERAPRFLFACVVCPQKFIVLKNLRLHINRKHADEGIMPCSVCDKILYSKEDLEKHESTHFGSKPFLCEFCDRRFAKINEVRGHVESRHSNKPRPKCELCGKTFQDVKILKKHMGTHTEEKTFKCTYCPNAYKFKYYLAVHMRKHTGEKLLNCRFCSETFVWKQNLLRHERRVHTGEKPAVCKICNKGFLDESSLYKHMRTHDKPQESEIDCEKCGEKFHRLKSYQKHVQKFHTPKMYACRRCKQMFSWTKENRSEIRPYLCEKCFEPPNTPSDKQGPNCSYMVVVDSTKKEQDQLSVRVVPYEEISVVIIYSCKVCAVKVIDTQANMDCDGVLSRCRKCAEDLVLNNSNIRTGRFTFPLKCHMCNRKSKAGLFVVDKSKFKDFCCSSCEKQMVECVCCEKTIHPLLRKGKPFCDSCENEHILCTVCENMIQISRLKSHLDLHFGLFNCFPLKDSLLLQTLLQAHKANSFT